MHLQTTRRKLGATRPADWAKRYRFLALAYCRRTWCHHLVLDFLAVRPGLTFAKQPVSGIGSGVLARLMDMADSLGMETMWGEATASSAPFYEKVLQFRPVKDLFIVRRDAMRSVREFYLEDQKSRLAKITKQKHSDRDQHATGQNIGSVHPDRRCLGSAPWP